MRGTRAFQLGASLAMKNKIINGCMRLWQRGTSFTKGASASGYTADRWLAANYNDGTIIVSQETSIMPDANTVSCMKIACSVTDTSLTNQLATMRHFVEGYNFLPLWNKNCSLSFWTRSNKTGTYCVSIHSTNATSPYASYIAEYTINAANTWEYKIIPLPIITGVAANWNFLNGVGLPVDFALAGGTGQYVGTANTWVSDASYFKYHTANQVNFMDNTANVFYLANVQLEQGGASTFEERDIGNELRLCQRYFWSAYNQGQVPGAGSWTGVRSSKADGNGYAITTVDFPVVMRSSPVGKVYSPVTGNVGYISDQGNVDRTAGFNCYNSGGNIQNTGGTIAYYNVHGCPTADAEL